MFLTEQFKDIEVRFLKAPNGEPVIIAADLINALKGDKANTADLIKKNVRSKWWIDLPNPNGGRPVRCLFEPGAYQLAGNPIFQTDFAEQFQDWLFEKVLPKLRSSGGYIMPTATSKQLEALKSEIISMENEIARVTQLNKEVSEIDAKLAFIIREIVDKILGQARNLRPSANSKKEEEYSEYWKTLYKLQPVLHKLFPMELTTKHCFDDTLTENTIHELFNVICLKVYDMTWENNFENCKAFNMSEH